MFYNCLNKISLNVCLYKNKSIKSWYAVIEFSFGWQEHTCNSLSPLSWLLKAVHSSCLYSRAPETGKWGHTALRHFCYTAKWSTQQAGGHFYLRYFHSPLLRMTTHFPSYHRTENRELKRRESLCLNSALYFFESLNTCTGDMHSKAHIFLEMSYFVVPPQQLICGLRWETRH